MADVHIFSNVWTRKINQNSVFFFLFLFFLIFKFDHFLFIDIGNSLVNELILQENVEEISGLVIWTLTDFRQLDLFNRVIFVDVRNNCLCHVLACGKTEGALLLELVEELHGGGALVVPQLILLRVHAEKIGELWHSFGGSLL